MSSSSISGGSFTSTTMVAGVAAGAAAGTLAAASSSSTSAIPENAALRPSYGLWPVRGSAAAWPVLGLRRRDRVVLHLEALVDALHARLRAVEHDAVARRRHEVAAGRERAPVRALHEADARAR